MARKKSSTNTKQPRDPSDDDTARSHGNNRSGNSQRGIIRNDHRRSNNKHECNASARNGNNINGSGGKKKKKKKNASLGNFIEHRDIIVEGSRYETPSVARSALTTPSVLTSHNEHDDDIGSAANSEDDSHYQPLLGENNNARGRNNGNAGGGGGVFGNGKKRGGGNNKRVGFFNGNNTAKYPSRSDRNNGGEPTSYEGSGQSALSMRRAKHRPWFAPSNNSSNSSYNKSFADVGRSYSATTGVQYRSATSTRRALEEIKRKKLEELERKRAMSILALLLVIAGCVHFVGRDASKNNGLLGILGLSSSVSTSDVGGVRGSRDKVYGDTKDLGYGGERNGASLVSKSASAGTNADGSQPAAAEGEMGANSQATEGGPTSEYGQEQDVGEEYEYQLPPPTERTYDPDHEFLLPLRHFADVSDPRRTSDTAFFFHVPRAAGSTFKSIIGKCLKLAQSSEVGVRDGHGTDPQLAVLDVMESRYVNVDTTTIPGIQRAVDLGLANSGLANVIVSSYLHESAALFDLEHQGRAFILLRDPIERATSMYWHRIKEVGDLDSSTSIEDYAQGNGIENNWMCRFLANRMTGELTKEDLEQAKEILKEKFLIGFVDDLEESVYRIMKYNGWKFSSDETDKMFEEDCIKDLAVEDGGGANINEYEYEIPKRGSQAHALISWQTQFDSKLYAYAREIFDKQTKEWGTKERKKALKKEKKKKGG